MKINGILVICVFVDSAKASVLFALEIGKIFSFKVFVFMTNLLWFVTCEIRYFLTACVHKSGDTKSECCTYCYTIEYFRLLFSIFDLRSNRFVEKQDKYMLVDCLSFIYLSNNYRIQKLSIQVGLKTKLSKSSNFNCFSRDLPSPP